MESYEIALFVHVLAAIVWVGGSIVEQALAARAVRADDPLEVARFSSDAEFIGMRVFLPASLLVVLAGGWMVYDGPWELSTTWVWLGLAIYLLSFLTGLGFLGPESGRINALTAEHGVTHPDVQRRIRRIIVVSRIETGWLLAVVALMVFKPDW